MTGDWGIGCMATPTSRQRRRTHSKWCYSTTSDMEDRDCVDRSTCVILKSPLAMIRPCPETRVEETIPRFVRDQFGRDNFA